MNSLRATIVALAAAGTVALGMLITSGPILAQAYPSKPVRIVVPFPPGGPSDIMARMIGQNLAELWGQRFVIENRPGANTMIGAEVVAHAPPDGYTLLLALDSTMTMNQYLYKKLPYDPFKDFAPITTVGRVTSVISVNAKTGPATLRELVERARANPGKLTFGTAALNSQIAGEMLKSLAGIDIVHVPYKGSGAAIQALLSGEITFIVDGLAGALPYVRAGTFRVLATTGSRPPNMPELQTISEAAGLPSFDVTSWQGFFAPAGTPAAIIDKLYAGIDRVANAPEVKGKLLDNGLVVTISASPSQFAASIRRDAELRAKVIKDSGISVE